jgi:acetate---CoA ligase (ADP-forming)
VTELAAALFAPKSVALIGASGDAGKAAARPLRFLRASGYGGRVYAVNPRAAADSGPEWCASLGELPEVPEHAYVMTPAGAAVRAAEQCAEMGVPVVTIMTSGFAESGPQGELRQRDLTAIARRSGTRILGPSSLGVVDLRSGLRLTANAAFGKEHIPPGPVFVASHSGSMIGAILSRGAARGLGFSALVSVGGEADLSLGEVCALAVDDPQVQGFVLFLESLRHAGDLRTFAAAAHGAGKPVVAYKLGRSPVAAELAMSHTGAMTGEDDLAQAFLDDCGIARVHTLDGLVESISLVGATPPGAGQGRAVGVLTTTGGGAAMVVDQLGLRGVEVRGPAAATLARLAESGVQVQSGRIADLTLAGTRPEIMRLAVEAMAGAAEFDLVVVVVGSSASLHPQLAVQPIADAWRAGHTGIAVFLVPEAPAALNLLAEAGVAAFRTPESCADAVTAALTRRVPRPRADQPPPGGLPAAAGRPAMLDERESYDVLAHAGVPVARYQVLGVGEPAARCTGITYPAAAKALTRRLPHKSDAGCVRLGLADAAALDAAVADIARRYLGHTGTRLDQVLVQPMESGLAEVLVGFRVDPDVGPVVLVAPGGTAAELRDERALRLAPVDQATAVQMIRQLPSLRSLRGFRHHPPGDVRALARLVVAMSNLATRTEVVEAEVNPVLVGRDGEGCVAVDAVVYVAPARTEPRGKENGER